MGHMSNRERIARAAEEAEIAAKEKKAAKEARPKSRRTAAPVRMKIVWEIANGAGTAVATFAYPDKAEADAKAAALTRSTERAHTVRQAKVPMD